MSLASNTLTLVKNENALQIFLRDSTSTGSAALMHLAIYSQYKPAIEPEAFDVRLTCVPCS